MYHSKEFPGCTFWSLVFELLRLIKQIGDQTRDHPGFLKKCQAQFTGAYWGKNGAGGMPEMATKRHQKAPRLSVVFVLICAFSWQLDFQVLWEGNRALTTRTTREKLAIDQRVE